MVGGSTFQKRAFGNNFLRCIFKIHISVFLSRKRNSLVDLK